MSRRINVELTAEQIAAAVTAIEATAVAGDLQDALAVYGNTQAVMAAVRAQDSLVKAGNKVGAFGRRRRRGRDGG